jgi:hypothetical protein
VRANWGEQQRKRASRALLNRAERGDKRRIFFLLSTLEISYYSTHRHGPFTLFLATCRLVVGGKCATLISSIVEEHLLNPSATPIDPDHTRENYITSRDNGKCQGQMSCVSVQCLEAKQGGIKENIIPLLQPFVKTCQSDKPTFFCLHIHSYFRLANFKHNSTYGQNGQLLGTISTLIYQSISLGLVGNL